MANRFAALCCAYYGHNWLNYSIDSVYDCVDSILIFVNSEPWYGPKLESRETIECIENLSDPQKKIRVILGSWSTQIEQRNFTLACAEVEGNDYGFILDTDEIYDTDQLRAMMRYAAARPEVECWHMRWYTYWKSLHWVIDPMEEYNPPVFIKLGTCGFVQSRNPKANVHELIPPEIGVCHHMSYARTDDVVRTKLLSFGHAPQIIPDWFEKVWLAWDKDETMTNLHPVVPSQYKHAIPQPIENLPPILRELARLQPNYPR